MPQDLIIVRAWNTPKLPMADVLAMVPALQQQLDQDFLPAWAAHGATQVTVSAVDHDAIPTLDPASWPIFLNRHSTDVGALGWHDDEAGRIFGRVFVGDCLRYGVDWRVTLSHEALELVADPTINLTATLARNGTVVALEVCDPVEADTLGYERAGQRVSDFVLPSYFYGGNGPYDFGGHLSAMAPALEPGGYISELVNGQWTQVTADLADGMAGARALMRGFRRMMRARS